jgi:hypothetical protein
MTPPPVRKLTAGEAALCWEMFGPSLDVQRIELRGQPWLVWQPKNVVMVPDGHFYFHPKSTAYAHDYSAQSVGLQAFFLHEATHAWQHQHGLNVVWRRGFWARYAYLPLTPGEPFSSYGIEQQAEIVRHAFLLSRDVKVPGAPPLETYRALLPFAHNLSGRTPAIS